MDTHEMAHMGHSEHASHHAEEGKPKEYAKFLAVLVGISLLAFAFTSFLSIGYMESFMGAFFLIFAFFKLLDLRGFVMSYVGYDIIARKFTAYAYAYPFIELLLATGYLFSWPFIDEVTLIVTTLGAIGVGRELLRGSKIKCACLGTYIKLPLTTISLVEDAGMGLMALYLLIVR